MIPRLCSGHTRPAGLRGNTKAGSAETIVLHLGKGARCGAVDSEDEDGMREFFRENMQIDGQSYACEHRADPPEIDPWVWA